MSSDYFPEILRFFVSKSRRLEVDYGNVQGWMRDKVVGWIWEICEEVRYSVETFQLAIEIFSIFLACNETTKHTIQLVAVVCLMLAVKYHEKTTFTLVQAATCCSDRYSINSIQISEFYVLQKLEWRVDIPTAAEITRSLLLATRISYDMSKIFERSDAFAVICYLDFNLSRFSSLEIAVTSAICALEQFNQLSFRNQWLNLLIGKLELDISRLDLCKNGLVSKLFLTTPIQDRSKIECLAREAISSLITNKIN